jgi:hypothetical protein
MSRTLPAHLGPIEDARVEQAAAAARTARQNQPKGLLAMASLLLLAALIYVAMSVVAQQAASDRLKGARSEAEEAVQLAGKLKALKVAASANPTTTATVSSLRTRIEQAGLEAGLSKNVPLPQERKDTVQVSLGSRKTHFEYTVADPSLPALLTWMQKAVAAVPGLEITSVSVVPEANNWRLRVIFSRWEKVEGT